MDNALGNENLGNQGEINDNVGQDVGVESTENLQDVTEEESSRYHQSRADKLSAENEQLKKYEKVGQLLESRPDLVQNLMGQIQGGQPTGPQRVEMSQDEFDPWEAFNDPKSKALSEEINTKTSGFEFLANINTSEILLWDKTNFKAKDL